MHVLVICSGNTCRSPMAEVLLREKAKAMAAGSPAATTGSTKAAQTEGLAPLFNSLQIQSAGISAAQGWPMSVPMEMLLQERGLDWSHQSQRISLELIDWADLILTMTRAHKVWLIDQIPDIADKIFTLKEYAGDSSQPDLDDPYGTDLDSYRQCAAEIEQACDRILPILHQQIQRQIYHVQ